MNIMLVCTLLSLCLGGLCWQAYRLPATMETRVAMLGFGALASILLLAGQFLWAPADRWAAESRYAVRQLEIQAEATGARAMVEALGGTGAYIEYLRAKEGRP
ncbi:hypothetical protein [Pseudomonas oryzihabitans]|uniref:hypothetical protein n=1 Tax=Pseudomonas oryzihabitans TaxID=47885 RepID=UPI0028A98C88|nr:hypothetical protein [Pseudomonas oryzihabitans]